MRQIMEILPRITLQEENCQEEKMLHVADFLLFVIQISMAILCVPELPLSHFTLLKNLSCRAIRVE
jgi:hypothetical protein